MKEELDYGEGFKTCPVCKHGIPEEDFEEHLRIHEDEEMWRAQEVLSAHQAGVALKVTSMAVSLEEQRLKKLYKYKIPKSNEILSSESIYKELAKELLVRKAMTDYTKVTVGEEEYDPEKWYVAPQEIFNPQDFTPGVNVFRIKHFTEEHAKKVEKELAERLPTSEIAEKVIKGEYDEAEPKIKEELAKDNRYEELTEKLFSLFEPMWTEGHLNDEGKPGSLNEVMLLNLGKEVFRYMRCPIENCNFKVPKKLSRKEKYVQLMKHFLTEHVDKVSGKAKLSVVKRVIETPDEDAMEEARKAFKVPIKPPKAEAPFSPNPEQCQASLESLTKLKDDSLPTVQERRKKFDSLKRKSKYTEMTNDLTKILGKTEKSQKVLEKLAEEKKKKESKELTLEDVMPHFESQAKKDRLPSKKKE